MRRPPASRRLKQHRSTNLSNRLNLEDHKGSSSRSTTITMTAASKQMMANERDSSYFDTAYTKGTHGDTASERKGRSWFETRSKSKTQYRPLPKPNAVQPTGADSLNVYSTVDEPDNYYSMID